MAFIKNCLAANMRQLLKFDRYTGRTNTIHDEINDFANPNLNIGDENSEIIRHSFKHSKKYICKGVFAFLFHFCALFTLKDGLLPMMANTFPGQERKVAMNGYQVEEPEIAVPPMNSTAVEVGLIKTIDEDSSKDITEQDHQDAW